MKDKELIKKARIAKRAGIKIVWIGEFEGFKDPFYVAELVAEVVEVVGFGILSPLKRNCKEILKLVQEFSKKNKTVVGIAPGSFDNPKKALEIT
ncbi:hypothetical protein DRO97_04550, partial [Archaeoglobales archaeon]